MMTRPSELQRYLDSTATNWATLGHPATIERFVLRQGKCYDIGQRIGPRGTPKECFSNAANFVLQNGPRYSYVEGFYMSPKLPIAIHHAWVRIIDNDAHLRGFDPTLDEDRARAGDYVGVEFDRDTLREELLKNKVYGLLDHGRGVNTDLLFRIDPELRSVVQGIITTRKHELL